MKNILLFALFTLLSSQIIVSQTITDVDGNEYNTIVIGTQEWMQENLRVTHFNTGASIPYVEENSAWLMQNEAAYCWYNHNYAVNGSSFGGLYNWFAANSNNLCPTGWKVPTNSDWDILSNFLGGSMVAGGKMKEMGTSHWKSPNTGATNESGFTGLPGGIRSPEDGSFGYITEGCGFWSSTQVNSNEAWDRFLVYADATLDKYNVQKQTAYSIRCVKTTTTGFKYIHQPILFPNPVVNMFSVLNFQNENSEMRIYNSVGELCLFRESIRDIDISSFKNGFYILKINNGISNYQLKIIKK
mgnify:CR=1 FL=1